jgi:hypothetical protein
VYGYCALRAKDEQKSRKFFVPELAVQRSVSYVCARFQQLQM